MKDRDEELGDPSGSETSTYEAILEPQGKQIPDLGEVVPPFLTKAEIFFGGGLLKNKPQIQLLKSNI